MNILLQHRRVNDLQIIIIIIIIIIVILTVRLQIYL